MYHKSNSNMKPVWGCFIITSHLLLPTVSKNLLRKKSRKWQGRKWHHCYTGDLAGMCIELPIHLLWAEAENQSIQKIRYDNKMIKNDYIGEEKCKTHTQGREALWQTRSKRKSKTNKKWRCNKRAQDRKKKRIIASEGKRESVCSFSHWAPSLRTRLHQTSAWCMCLSDWRTHSWRPHTHAHTNSLPLLRKIHT